MVAGDARKTLIVAIVVTAVIAVLVGAGGAWLARAAEIRDLEERLASAERRLAEIAESAGALAGTDDSQETTPAEPAEAEPADEEIDAEPGAEAEAESGRVPAIVTDVRTTGGVHYVTLDYIQFLTGDEAAAAAAARGDESPPPNGYYIVNENPRLREFPVRNGIAVHVVYAPSGGSVPEGLTVPLADWVAAMPGPSGAYYRIPFYWVTLTDGTVTALEQQYLP